MTEKRFSDPKLTISRVYTRRGDGGQTRLVGGQQLPKDDLRIECYGTVDELLAAIGMALVTAREASERHEALGPLAERLLRIQHELFNLGSLLATRPEDVGDKQPQVTGAEVGRLEEEIDELNAELSPLRSFVLPAGSRLSVELHVGRTICRRAERLCVALLRRDPETSATTVGYLNRLSDALFVFSRWADHAQGLPEVLWDPNIGAAGAGKR